MKLCLLFVLFFPAIFYGQSDPEFTIKENIEQNIFKRKRSSSFKSKDGNFFEDSLFACFKGCNGEFGGAILFINKQNGQRKQINATCPIVVNKLNHKYFVTITLAHMGGSSEVIVVDSNLAVNKIADVNGVLVLTSFVYNSALFHIISDLRRTYLAKVEEGRFKNIALISDTAIWTYDPEMKYTNNGHLIVFFKNYDTKGYMEIYDNNIVVNRYK